jgi:hypothetical protein
MSPQRDPLTCAADLKFASERTADDWTTLLCDLPCGAVFEATVSCLLKLRTLFTTTCGLLKKMGDSAGVGIEPEAQSRLCDLPRGEATVQCVSTNVLIISFVTLTPLCIKTGLGCTGLHCAGLDSPAALTHSLVETYACRGSRSV